VLSRRVVSRRLRRGERSVLLTLSLIKYNEKKEKKKRERERERERLTVEID